VIAAVLGARGTPAGRRPIGRTALRVVEQANKPVVVVPPVAARGSRRPFQRLLVPLDATAESFRPIEATLRPLLAHEVELIVLHVFTDTTMPRTLDRPARDLALLGDEFLARYCPTAARIVFRTGAVADQVAALSHEQESDLVVLSWSQDASADHAAVIREVLSRSIVPVLLLPADSERVVDQDGRASELAGAPGDGQGRTA
jgi:hypothetical protein